MKPIVFTDFKHYDDSENLLIINKDVLNKLVDDAYNTGVEDGRKMLYTPTITAYGNWIKDIEPECVGRPSPCETTITSNRSVNNA